MPETLKKSEVDALRTYLDHQRNHVMGILAGLDDADLRRPLLPSGWTPIGMLQHLALDVERFWFAAVIAGDQERITEFDDMPSAWIVGPDVPIESVFELYRQEIERANAIIAPTPLDSAPAWWPRELFGDDGMSTVREVILHVMTETASHAGHLDIARELVDGRQWLVLTG